MNKVFKPENAYIGGYTDRDGTIEFYQRIRTIITQDSTVLDIGAGRGAWLEDDQCCQRRRIRDIKDDVAELIGLDVDPAVMKNRATTRNIVITSSPIDLPSDYADCIIADYVLEHIEDPNTFAKEIGRLLKPGGFFCARTPHILHHGSIASRLLNLVKGTNILFTAQPERNKADVFPAFYRLNTPSAIRRHFGNFIDYSYVYRCDPAYYFGSEIIYRLSRAIFSVCPSSLSGNIMVFTRKPLSNKN